ncbi:MAG: glycosyltransferase family 2 protein [Actinobacteria bacterium]|nr:MAG: glycosyltransferase family 2 protein [Actinomycetota bacterium]
MIRPSKDQVSIVIPCYNEERGLPQLISKLAFIKKNLSSSIDLELVFVDDGSIDATYKVLRQKYNNSNNVKILKHAQNRGVGAALRTGFSEVTGNIIVTIDSDCSYDPRQIPKLINTLDKQTDIVIGSPYHPKGGVEGTSFMRMFLSQSLSKVYKVLLSSDLHTYTGIFRAYRRNIIKSIDFKADDFISLSEILVKAILRGYRIREYPTILHCRKFGRSKIHIFATMFHHLRFICRLIVSKKCFLERGDEVA